jgi:hypothetical protein
VRGCVGGGGGGDGRRSALGLRGPGVLPGGGHQVAPSTPELALAGSGPTRSPRPAQVQPAHLLQPLHAAAAPSQAAARGVGTGVRRGRDPAARASHRAVASSSLGPLQAAAHRVALEGEGGRRSRGWSGSGVPAALDAGWPSAQPRSLRACVRAARRLQCRPAALVFDPLFSGSRGNDGRGQPVSQDMRPRHPQPCQFCTAQGGAPLPGLLPGSVLVLSQSCHCPSICWVPSSWKLSR